MPYDSVPGSTDPAALDGGVYQPIPNDPSVLINANAASSAAAAALSALQAAASAVASAASASASDASAIAAAASAAAALASQIAAAASAAAALVSENNAQSSEDDADASAVAALASQNAAAASAAAALVSQNAASASAAAALISQNAAAASAAAALTSENNADISEAAAAASASAAAASYDSFDDRYLGVKAVAPTLDNDGNALQQGALYFDSVTLGMYVWSGAAWESLVAGVASFNGRTGAVTLLGADVTTALGYTPVNKAGDTMTGTLAVNPASGHAITVAVNGANDGLFVTADAAQPAILRVAADAGNAASSFAFFQDGSKNGYVWQIGAFPLLFGTSNTERMRIGSAGNVTISAPTSGIAFGVAGVLGNNIATFGVSGNPSLGLAVDATYGYMGTITNHALSFQANSAAKAWLTVAGSFGVGAVPSDVVPTGTNKLSATHNGAVTIAAHDNGANNLRIGMFADSANSLAGWDLSYSTTFSGYVWRHVGAELARLNTSGLGIGVAPATKLHVKGSSGVQILETTAARGTGALYMILRDPTGDKGFLGYGGGDETCYFYSYTNGAMILGTNNRSILTLASTGETTVAAPASGVSLTLNAASGNYWLQGTDGTAQFAAYSSTTNGVAMGMNTNHDWNFYTNGYSNVRFKIAAGGVVSYGGVEVGYKEVPRSSGLPSLTEWRGRCAALSAGITLTGSDGYSAGMTMSIYNDSASAITITQGASTTLRLAGTTTTGNRTLAARGLCTIWWNSGTEAIMSGAGLT
jgi:hypothetical protein